MVGLRAIWEIRMVGDRYCLNCREDASAIYCLEEGGYTGRGLGRCIMGDPQPPRGDFPFGLMFSTRTTEKQEAIPRPIQAA